MNDALNFAVSFILEVVTFIFVARFLLQACRVDFYNPISQGLVKATDPLLRPVRMVLPGYRNLDFAAFLAAVLVQVLLILSLTALQGAYLAGAVDLLATAVLKVIMLCIQIFWWSILIVIIAGWIAPGTYHPALALLAQITEPLLAPARRLLPPMGGLDFSPIVVILLLGVIQRILPDLFRAVL